MYGCGLYTTFAIESQFTNYMQTYGQAVVKFKVEELDKYLIFQLSVAKQIHGKDYKISDQLKKLGLLNKPNVNEIKLKYYDEQQEKEKYSSALAKQFYEQNGWIVNSVKGIIYYGANDGYCLVKYPTVKDGTITMLGYAVAEPNNMKKMEELKSNIGWIKSVGTLGTAFKTTYKAPEKMKEKLAFGSNTEIENVKSIFLNSKNLERTAKKLESNLKKLSDKDISDLLDRASDKDQMAEVIIKYIPELYGEILVSLFRNAKDKDKVSELIINYNPKFSRNNVYHLISYSTDKDKIAQLIIEKHQEISDSDVYSLAVNTKDRDKIAQLIIQKKSNLSDKNVGDLIYAAINKEKIAELIIEKKPELSDNNVFNLIQFANDKEKIAEIILNKNPKLSDDTVENLLLKANDKEKMAELIIRKKPELSNSNVYSLLGTATDKDKMSDLIIRYKKTNLSNSNVFHLLFYSKDKDKIAERLGSDNISKLSDKNISSLLDNAIDRREQMAKIIIKYKENLSGDDVSYLTSNLKDNTEILELILNNLRQSKYPVHDKVIGWIFDRSKDKDKTINDIIQILKEKNQEISIVAFQYFVQYATDKLKMAMTLIKIKKQLSLEEASILIRNAKDINEMVKLIDKPYSFLKSLTSLDAFRYKKSPEVQDMINQELKRRKRIRFSSDFD
jgi:hypothetical protein